MPKRFNISYNRDAGVDLTMGLQPVRNGIVAKSSGPCAHAPSRVTLRVVRADDMLALHQFAQGFAPRV